MKNLIRQNSKASLRKLPPRLAGNWPTTSLITHRPRNPHRQTANRQLQLPTEESNPFEPTCARGCTAPKSYTGETKAKKLSGYLKKSFTLRRHTDSSRNNWKRYLTSVSQHQHGAI